MTAPRLVAAFTARGVQLVAHGNRLRVDAPRGVLTDADRAALVAHRAEIIELLHVEAPLATAAADDSWAVDVPDRPCGLCGHQPLAEVRDWPVPGAARWLCPACAPLPVPSLEAVYASLSVDERRRLVDEARAGDPLARVLLRLVPVSGAA